MRQDRRSFIFGMTALAGAIKLGAAEKGAAESAAKRGPVRLRIGVCSDIHSGPWDHGKGFARACAWWKKAKIDALVIAGDIADCGDVASCGYVRDIIQKEFGDNWPEMVVCWGNHDNGGDKEKRLTPENRAMVLKDYFRIPEAGDANTYLRKVKGYTFVANHWQGSWNRNKDLGEFFAAHAGDLKGPKPFFYVQHPHVKGTCHGPWALGQDDGSSTELLRHHPNAVCFSGHSHTPLTDERTVWKGEFISIGTASMTNMSYPPGRANSSWGICGEPQQSKLNEKIGCHAMLVSVCDDVLVVERRADDFTDERTKLGDDWVIPLGSGVPWTFEARAAESVAPAFAAGAALKVERRMGVPRDQKQPELDQWVVSFPTALAHDGRPRAFEYEVTAVCDGWGWQPRVVRRVFSEKFMKPFHEDSKAYCIFADKELPPLVCGGGMGEKCRGGVRFEVRPVSPFGKLGEALVSETFERSENRPSEKKPSEKNPSEKKHSEKKPKEGKSK